MRRLVKIQLSKRDTEADEPASASAIKGVSEPCFGCSSSLLAYQQAAYARTIPACLLIPATWLTPFFTPRLGKCDNRAAGTPHQTNLTTKKEREEKLPLSINDQTGLDA